MPLVDARDLTKIYRIRRGGFREPAELTACGGITFTLEEGKTLAVVGESGSGKSTLARLVTMIEPPSAGTLMIGGRNALQRDGAHAIELRRMVQMVFQNPYGSLNPRKSIGDILEQPLAIATAMSKAERRKRARDMLERVGLRPEHAERFPHMFSGGQRQRIAIARALMLSPKLVVADEPVSALDVSVQAQVLNLFADLQRDLRLTYLFISHDLAVVRYIADDVLVMYLGLVMEHAPKEQLFTAPKHPYTQALLAATPSIERTAEKRHALRGDPPSPLAPPPGCVFASRCPLVFDRCRTERPQLRHIEGRQVACHLA